MLQLPVSKTRRRITRNNPSVKVFPPSAQATHPTPSVSVVKRGKRTQNNDNILVHVEDCGRMTPRIKMALNGYSGHFVKCGITQHAEKLWMNSSSWVMVVRIPTRGNNHIYSEGQYCQTNSHGLRKVEHMYSYQFSFVLVIFMHAMTSNQ